MSLKLNLVSFDATIRKSRSWILFIYDLMLYHETNKWQITEPSVKTDHKKKMQKANGPRTELFGTLKSISSHLLYLLIILTLCSLLLW